MIFGNSQPISINGVGFVNCADIVDSWSSNYTAYIITKEIKNFVLVETKKKVNFQGVVQNLNKKELELKPIGERNWGWYELHSTKKFNNDDLIEINGIRYRIMSTRNNDTYYGFWAYTLLQDYNNSTEINNG